MPRRTGRGGVPRGLRSRTRRAHHEDGDRDHHGDEGEPPVAAGRGPSPLARRPGAVRSARGVVLRVACGIHRDCSAGVRVRRVAREGDGAAQPAAPRPPAPGHARLWTSAAASATALGVPGREYSVSTVHLHAGARFERAARRGAVAAAPLPNRRPAGRGAHGTLPRPRRGPGDRCARREKTGRADRSPGTGLARSAGFAIGSARRMGDPERRRAGHRGF
jgi:hypothetical protein